MKRKFVVGLLCTMMVLGLLSAPAGARTDVLPQESFSITPVSGWQVFSTVDIATSGDGSMFVVGSVGESESEAKDLALAKLRPDGTLDRGFGQQGVVTYDHGQWESARAVAVDAQGRILVGGTTGNTRTGYTPGGTDYPVRKWLLVRFTADGLIDPSFGQSGSVEVDLEPFAEREYACTPSNENSCYRISFENHSRLADLALGPTGNILVGGWTVGWSDDQSSRDMFVASFNSSGELDRTFGAQADGVVRIGDPSLDESMTRMAVANDGSITAVALGAPSDGVNQAQYSPVGYTVARLKPDGHADGGFGQGGLVHFPGDATYSLQPRAVLVDEAGAVIIGSTRIDRTARHINAFPLDGLLVKLDSTGTPDPTFGNSGVVIIDEDFVDTVDDLHRDRDGRIIVAGITVPDTGDYVVGDSESLSRYTADGHLDSTFGGCGTGRMLTQPSNADAEGDDGSGYYAQHVRLAAQGEWWVTIGRGGSNRPDQTGVYAANWIKRKHVLDVDEDGTERRCGRDRFETAATLALTGSTGGADTIYLATGANFADALTAGPLVSDGSSALLLTHATSLPAATARALRRLQPSRVVALGGHRAVTDGVLDAAAAAAGGAATDRLAGRDRFETAAAIASRMARTDTVYLATGLDFPDALSAAAVTKKAPILLVGDGLPPATAAALRQIRPTRIIALGGANAVSPSVLAAASEAAGQVATERLRGDNRFATAIAIARTVPTPRTVYVTTGLNFPDALAAASHAAAEGAPILLVKPTEVPDETRAFLAQLPDLQRIVVLGGRSAISDAVRLELGRFVTSSDGL